MAFFDDTEVLTAHLRHSFITSDDTGICELIMVNEDLDSEIKTDNTFSKRALRLTQRYNPVDFFIHHGAKSLDIQASPTLARRPPLKNNANLFEVVEKKKSRGSQVKTVTWNDSNNAAFDPEMFPRRELVKRSNKAEQEPSMLVMMLAAYNKLSANPFFKYSKFNGDNHGIGVANTYRIFLSMSKTPLQPVTVTVLHTATVNDLLGLTFWKYIDTTKDPVKLRSVKRYSVMIAEEDGEIDTDLPELEKGDRIAKFGFKYLGIVEVKKRSHKETNSPSPPPPVVKVFYEEGGFSTLALEDYSTTMGEILATVIRKRRLQIHGYELVHEDTPGVPVDLNSTLKMHRSLDFMLVKNQGQPKGSFGMSRGEESTDLPDVKDELTFYQYKSYNVVLVNKVRSNSDVILGISGEQIEIEPVGNLKSFFPRSSKSQKPATHEMKRICGCDIIDDKSSARTVFRVVRLGKDGSYKNIDFEAPAAITKEIVRKMTLILDGLSGGIRSDYLGWKEVSRPRKGTKSTL